MSDEPVILNIHVENGACHGPYEVTRLRKPYTTAPSALRTFFQAKKNPEILTFVGLPDF